MKRREAAGHKVCVWITPVATHSAAGRRILHYPVTAIWNLADVRDIFPCLWANPTLATVESGFSHASYLFFTLMRR